MKKSPWRVYTAFILLTQAVGALAGFLTMGSMERFETIAKSSLTPPAIVFPIVWTILYALMGISAARIYLTKPSAAKDRALYIYFLQLLFNFFWSLFFFNLGAYGFAFIWLLLLWLLIAAMIISFARIDRTAALLQLPYLLWVSFAGYLNFVVWRLN